MSQLPRTIAGGSDPFSKSRSTQSLPRRLRRQAEQTLDRLTQNNFGLAKAYYNNHCARNERRFKGQPPLLINTMDKERDAVAFQVVDSIDGDSARADCAGRLRGAVRPLLEWETRSSPIAIEPAGETR